MEVEKVNICDECKKVISDFKCPICDRDICLGCRSYILLSIEKDRSFTVNLCKTCEHTIQDGCLKNIPEHNKFIDELFREFKSYFIERVKSRLLINKLKNGN